MLRFTLLALLLTGCTCDISVGQIVYKASNGMPGEVLRVNWFDGCRADIFWNSKIMGKGVRPYLVITDRGEE